VGKIGKHIEEAKALYNALGHDERVHNGATLVLVVALRQYLEDLGVAPPAPEDALKAYAVARKATRREDV